jgi:transposase
MQSLDNDLLELLSRQISQVETHIKTSLEADKATQNRVTILRSIPGVGPVLSAILIAEMPELGHASDAKVAALAGLAPIASGQHSF